jgi:hypothetical protein
MEGPLWGFSGQLDRWYKALDSDPIIEYLIKVPNKGHGRNHDFDSLK